MPEKRYGASVHDFTPVVAFGAQGENYGASQLWKDVFFNQPMD